MIVSPGHDNESGSYDNYLHDMIMISVLLHNYTFVLLQMKTPTTYYTAAPVLEL
jgi:hypothetical protein